MTQTDRSRLQFTLSYLLGAFVVGAIVMAISAALEEPLFLLTGGILLAALLAHKIARAPLWAVVCLANGMEFYLCAWIAHWKIGFSLNPIDGLCALLGFLFCIAAAVIFLVRTFDSPFGSVVSALGLIVSLAVLAFWTMGVVPYISARRQGELARFAAQDGMTVVRIVREVEALRVKLGRAPRDERELEELRGRPMPCVHDYGQPRQIGYYRTGDNSFKLHYELWATDDWTYDSANPALGWVQSYY